MTNWIKNNITALVMIAMAVIIFLQRCDKKTETQQPRRDTVTSVQYIPQPTQTASTQPIIIESKQPVYIPPQYVPPTNNDSLLKQYINVVNKLLSQNKVYDSIKLKDSSGYDVGTVRINDLVSENEIKKRDVNYNLSFPVRTTTITITQPPVKKLQLYLGGGIGLNSFNVGGLVKTKNDALFGASVNVGFNGAINYNASTYWKLRLK